MRPCDLTTGVGRITHAFKTLKEHWSEIKTQWRDDASRQFEENHLKLIPPQLQMVLGAAQRLSEVVEKAARELDDRADDN